MERHVKILEKCILFKQMDEKKIVEMLNHTQYVIDTYNKKEIIALQEDKCVNIGIILKGKIELNKIFPSGKSVNINNFSEGNIFGEAIVFSEKHTYPATILALEYTEIMHIHKNDIIRLCKKNDIFLNNFMTLLSNRVLMLNNKIKNLSFDTIKKKIANLLLEEYQKQKSNFIILPYSRKKMAEILNIPRPSLSRELINMREEGIISFDKNVIKILDLKLLEMCIIQ